MVVLEKPDDKLRLRRAMVFCAKEHGLTNQQIAERLGVSGSTVSRDESWYKFYASPGWPRTAIDIERDPANPLWGLRRHIAKLMLAAGAGAAGDIAAAMKSDRLPNGEPLSSTLMAEEIEVVRKWLPLGLRNGLVLGGGSDE
jgi:DNA-binding XRE family transcriptional regulator